MSLTLRNVQLDCPPASFDASVVFWVGALGAEPVQRDGGRYVHLHGARSPVEVHLQRLDDGPSRVHLDLAADADVDAEVARLERLGATVTARHDRSIVEMRDPTGLVLCVVEGSAPPAPRSDERGPGPWLAWLIIDEPPEQADPAAAFWAEALGADGIETTIEDDGQPWTTLSGIRVAGGNLPVALQRVGPDASAPPPRFHLDLAAGDLPDAASRLESFGARRLSTAEDCIVLADPSGHRLCVVAPQDGEGRAS